MSEVWASIWNLLSLPEDVLTHGRGLGVYRTLKTLFWDRHDPWLGAGCLWNIYDPFLISWWLMGEADCLKDANDSFLMSRWLLVEADVYRTSNRRHIRFRHLGCPHPRWWNRKMTSCKDGGWVLESHCGGGTTSTSSRHLGWRHRRLPPKMTSSKMTDGSGSFSSSPWDKKKTALYY